MESAERLWSLGSLRASRAASSRELRREKNTRKGRASATAHHLLAPLQLLLLLTLLAYPAKFCSTAVFAQYSEVGPILSSSLEESAVCNTTVYREWYDMPYSGALLVDLVDFWIFSDAELTNGQVQCWTPSNAQLHLCNRLLLMQECGSSRGCETNAEGGTCSGGTLIL